MNKYCNDFHNGENIFFCKIDFILEEFAYLQKLKRNVVLIVSSGDITLSEDIVKYCPDNVRQIFATNTNVLTDLVIPIPTGIENEFSPIRTNHGMINSEIFPKLKYLNFQSRELIKEHDRYYANFSTDTPGGHLFSIFGGYRDNIKKICQDSDFIDFESGLHIDDYFKKVITYGACISPTGNGLECVRTWELLYMDRVPIVIGGLNLHSAIYEKIYRHLPLVFIESLKMLLDRDFLENKVEKCFSTPKDKLDYNYWKDFISEKIKKIKL